MPKRSDNVYTRKDRPGYWIDYKDARGKRRRVKVAAGTRGQARKLVRSEKTKAEEKRILGYAPPSKESFEVVAEKYLKHQKARVSAANCERERGITEKHLKEFFSGDISQVRRGDIHRYLSRRTDAGASSGTIIKELNVLKHLLGLCVDLWEYISVNPCHEVKPPKAAAGRVRYLRPTELKAILEATPAWLRPIVALAVSTGIDGRRS